MLTENTGRTSRGVIDFLVCREEAGGLLGELADAKNDSAAGLGSRGSRCQLAVARDQPVIG